MAKTLSLLPPDIPWDDMGGKVTPEWYAFLQFLYSRVGGSTSQSNNELIVGQLDDAGIEEIKQDLYALRDQIASQFQQLQMLIDEIGMVPAPYVKTDFDYDPTNVAISGGSINGTTIGATSASTGKFTTLTSGNAAALVSSSIALNNGAGAGAGTITNAPTAGNPSKWVPINDNGTIRYIPSW